MVLGCQQGAPCFRRYDRELVSKPAISLKKGWGGYRRTIRNNRENACQEQAYLRHDEVTTAAERVDRTLSKDLYLTRSMRSSIPRPETGFEKTKVQVRVDEQSQDQRNNHERTRYPDDFGRFLRYRVPCRVVNICINSAPSIVARVRGGVDLHEALF